MQEAQGNGRHPFLSPDATAVADIFGFHCSKERKNALQLLSEIVNDGNADLCDDALELAAQNGRTDTDSLRQCYYMVAKKEYRPDPLKMTSGPILNYNPNLSVFDGLMGGDVRG